VLLCKKRGRGEVLLQISQNKKQGKKQKLKKLMIQLLHRKQLSSAQCRGGEHDSIYSHYTLFLAYHSDTHIHMPGLVAAT